MNAIKSRMKSVSSTMQITKAMELVATSKLRRAKELAERSRPFYETMKKAIDDVQRSNAAGETVWTKEPDGDDKSLYIVIAGDRGLAGGYNSNIFKLTETLSSSGKNAVYLAVGKKAQEYYTRKGREVYASIPTVADVGVGEALRIGESVCQGLLLGKFSKVVLVYTKFASMISQIPTYEQILPLESETKGDGNSFDPILGGDAEEMLDKIVPKYVGGMIYSAICEAVASECGARRTAMNSANKNAEEMIDTLMLKFNRARQSVITQEITEIVSGAEAL